LQIYRWLLLLLGVTSPGNPTDRLESRDAVLVNFHHRYNVSKTAIFRNGAYLPPAEVPDFSLPEVIDNRARNAIANESRGYPNLPYYLPEGDSSRALTRKGSQDTRNPGRDRLQTSQRPRRPVSSPQDKHPRRTTTPPPPPAETPMSSLANRISIEEMSCQNSRDELFFR